MHAAFVTLALALAASARPLRRQEDFALANGEEAIALNEQFATLTPNSPCTAPQDACINDQFAQCVGGSFVLQPCGPGTICAALPLNNSPGTTITCTTAADRDARIAATGATGAGNGAGNGADAGDDAAEDDADNNAGGNAGDNAEDDEAADEPNNAGDGEAAGNDNDDADADAGNDNDADADAGNDNDADADAGNDNDAGADAGNEDPQTSLTLDPAVIAQGFAQDGQDPPVEGQIASLTSTNNFINFCLTVDAAITNGEQNEQGSCNPAPIGHIPAKSAMPSSKFVFPPNGGTVQADVAFDIEMQINNMITGNFVNAQKNYFAAPQQLQNGLIVGHSHVVVELLDSLDQTTPTDPEVFAFFKGLNEAADGSGILRATVDGENPGLPVGSYRLCSINAAANHQPVIVPVAQHGALDDCVYFTAE